MFDLDQRRTALPNGGNMYCVPTSFVNNLAYLRKYGMNLMTGNFNPASHDDMSALILLLGILMGTDPQEGTSGSVQTEIAWVDSRTTKLVFFGAYGPSSTWGYRTIMNTFRSGSLVRMAYGRYRNIGGEWSRQGGHSVTLGGHIRSDTNSTANAFFVADPAADEGDPNGQSNFIFQQKDTSNITLTTENHGVVTHARYTDWTGQNGDRRAVVDSMVAILPVYAGWPAVEGDATTFTIKVPWQMNPSATNADFPTQFQTTVPDSVSDWCFDPAEFAIVYVTPSGAVKRTEVSTGETTQLMQSAAARKVAVGGPDMDVFVLRDGSLFDSVTRVKRKDGALTTRTLPTNVVGIDIDDTTGGIACLEEGLGAVLAYDVDFRILTRRPLRSLSTAGPIRLIGGGAPLFSIDQSTGDYYVSSEGSSSWMNYRKASGYRAGMPTTIRGSVKRIFPGAQGTVFVQDLGDRIHTYTQSGNPAVTDFTDMAAAGPVCIGRSFTMHRAGEMVGPGWENVLPVGNEP